MPAATSAASSFGLRPLRHSLGRSPDGLDVTVVEVPDLGTVVEQHPVALPVEAVREQDASVRADRHAVQLDDVAHVIADRSGSCTFTRVAHPIAR